MNIVRNTTIIVALISTASSATTYQVQKGDSLIKVLRERGYGKSFLELYPFLEEIKKSNGPRFESHSIDLIYPNEKIILPALEQEVEEVAQVETLPKQDLDLTETTEENLEYIGDAFLRSKQVEYERSGLVQQLFENIGVLSHDKYTTGKLGRVDIKLEDNSQYIVGPDSQFSIEEYFYEPSSDKNILNVNLLKGAVGAETGEIGKSKSDTYIMKTPTTSLGVRGTEYTIRVCQTDCGDLVGTSVAVKEGSIYLTSKHGRVDVKAGKFAQVKTMDAKPIVGDIPKGFFDIDKNPKNIKKSFWQKVVEYVGGVVD